MSFEEKIVVGCIAMLLLISGAAVYLSLEEAKAWQAFKTQHQCKIVTKIRGETFNTVGFDSKGNATVGIGSTSDKTGWLCDDGITYYR